MIYGQLWVQSFSGVKDLIKRFLEGGWVYFSHLAIFVSLLSFIQFRSFSKKYQLFIIAAFFSLSFLLFIFIAGDKTILAKIILPILWLSFSGVGLSIYLRNRWGLDLAFFAGILLILIAIEFVLFFAGWLGVSNFSIKLFLILILIAPGLTCLATQARREFTAGWEFFYNLKPHGWIYCESIFLLFCLGLLHAYAPETLVDATSLHIPKAGNIANSNDLEIIKIFPYMPFTLIAPYVHIIFSQFFAFAGEHGIKGLTLMMIPVIAGCILQISESFKIEKNLRLLPCVLFLFFPAFIWHYGCGYIDVVSSAFALAAVATIFSEMNREPKKPAHLFIAGLFFGAAVSSKLSLVIFFIAFLVSYILCTFCSKNEDTPYPSTQEFILLSSGALLLISPHLLFQYLLTGNPVFPALNKLFPSPYWNPGLNTEAIQKFIELDFMDWILFPYTLVRHTSFFGSAVENVDGTAGFWFLLLFPLIIPTLKDHHKNIVILIALITSFLYIAFLATLGTYYLRYYFPVIAILFCLIVRGVPEKWWDLRSNKFKNNGIISSILIAALSFLPLTFGTVWSPAVSHWNQLLNGSQSDWLNKIYPDFDGFKRFAQTLPGETKVFAYHVDPVSHISLPTVYFRTPDIVFSGQFGFKNNKNFQLNQKFREFNKQFTKGKFINSFDIKELMEMISNHGDILLFSRLEDMDFMKHSGWVSVERLMYSSAKEVGAFPKFFVAFRLNETLFPPADGTKMVLAVPKEDTPSLDNNNQRWKFLSNDGSLENKKDSEDVWAVHNRYFSRKVLLPSGTSTLKMILELNFKGEPDYYPGVQLNWLGENDELIQIRPLGVFYSENKTGVYAIEDIPKGATQVAIILRPNLDRYLGISRCELFLETAN